MLAPFQSMETDHQSSAGNFYLAQQPAASLQATMITQAMQCCSLVQDLSGLRDMMERFAACRYSFNAAWAPVGNEAALPEPVVAGPRRIFNRVGGKTITMDGSVVKDAGLQGQVHISVERDKLLARYLKKSLTRLATLGSSNKPIRQTYTHFVQQTTAVVAAFTQQLAHFQAMQRDSKAVLADILLEVQTVLHDLEDSELQVSAGFLPFSSDTRTALHEQ